MKTKLEPVHMIYRGDQTVGFFRRDEVSNKNIIYTTSQASLEEIAELFTDVDAKI